MKKIGQVGFNARILGGSFRILVDGAVPGIDPSEVREMKVGNKYFYELHHSSIKKRFQTQLQSSFLSKIPVNNASTAYRKHQSYLNFLEPHRKNYHFLRLDISSFFHSIRVGDIKAAFSSYFEDEMIDSSGSQKLIDAFVALTCYKVPNTSPNREFAGKEILPIGFLASPTISNIVFRKIDIQLQKYCYSHGITYSRYADDLLFSSKKSSTFVHSYTFETEVRVAVSQLGLRINKKKTKRSNHAISLNGYVIESSTEQVSLFSKIKAKESEIRISNKKTDIIKKLLHMIVVEKRTSQQIMEKVYKFRPISPYAGQTIPIKIAEKLAKDQLFNKLTGYRAYLISIVKFDRDYNCISVKTIEKYQKLIADLNRVLDGW